MVTIFQRQIANSAKLAALGEMAAGVAHEINNPLAIVSGSARILKKLSEAESVDRDAFAKKNRGY